MAEYAPYDQPFLHAKVADGRIDLQTIMAKILYERPGLKLETQGQADPEKDMEGLRQTRFEENLKATRLKALVALGRKILKGSMPQVKFNLK